MCPPLFFTCFTFFFMCVCFFSVCVLCASRSPGATEKSTQHEDELYIESAPLAEILSNMRQLCQANSQKSTQIGEFSTRLSPKQLHNFKKNFRLYHETSPKQSVQFVCQLFHVTFQKTLQF